jgi:hypothetical protein
MFGRSTPQGRSPTLPGAQLAGQRSDPSRPAFPCLVCRGQGVRANGKPCPIFRGTGYW